MAHELITTKQGELVSALDQQKISDLLKPLSKEIHLFDTFVAGTTHLEDASPLQDIKGGDTLSLRREVNKFDDFAILILNAEEKKIGYIPEKDNKIFARLMDAGKQLKAKVIKAEQRGSFHQITIGIYLVDF